jgi:DNA-binding LytR/AlgR family response regulator
MKIIVCEDTGKDGDVLCSLIKKYFKEINCPVEIAVYENGGSFLDALPTLKADDVKIAFLDIFMPGITGIDVARKIRETDKEMVIVFTTTSVDHGLDGYSVGALQYLVKPVGYPELEDILNKCVKLFADSLRSIEVLSDRLTVRVLLKNILYVEILKHTCLIHTLSETIKNYHSLDEIERQLDEGTFLRTHRSFIVNMRYINDVTENDFILTNGAAVPIRKNDKMTIKQAYRDYLFVLAGGI